MEKIIDQLPTILASLSSLAVLLKYTFNHLKHIETNVKEVRDMMVRHLEAHAKSGRGGS